MLKSLFPLITQTIYQLVVYFKHSVVLLVLVDMLFTDGFDFEL
jgi:hypothetical protein